MRVVHLPPGDVDALASRVAAMGGRLRLRAGLCGTSMAPALRPGDLLDIETVPPARLAPGDVVVYRGSHGRLVAHRIVRAPDAGGVARVRADADGAAPEAVPEEAIIGRVLAVRRSWPLVTLARRVLARLRRW